MLTEKDYCDYETCVALRELGFTLDMTEKVYERNLMTNRYETTPKPLLYEAQKFLREEKKIIIEANFNLMYKGRPRFSYRVLYNLTQHKGAYYTLDSVMSKEDYDSYEEALLEGIKEAVKILKDGIDD